MRGKQVLVRPCALGCHTRDFWPCFPLGRTDAQESGGSPRPRGSEGLLGEKTRDWVKQAGQDQKRFHSSALLCHGP